jgi:hypothetical protein
MLAQFLGIPGVLKFSEQTDYLASFRGRCTDEEVCDEIDSWIGVRSDVVVVVVVFVVVVFFFFYFFFFFFFLNFRFENNMSRCAARWL